MSICLFKFRYSLSEETSGTGVSRGHSGLEWAQTPACISKHHSFLFYHLDQTLA